jgi:DNA-3-methyladenine glycosylase II
MRRLESESDLAAALEYLIAVEPRFAAVVTRFGLPPLRQSEAGLQSLLRIVTDQLISLKAGEAIWARLTRQMGSFEPAAVLAIPEADLCALGLTRAKARTFHAAARAFQEGRFADAGGGFTSELNLSQRLMEIPGIGPWTANIYLMVVVRSADSWPAADLALQRAAMDLLSLPEKPGSREMTALGEYWRPYRSAAALLLWSHYRGMKRMPQH